MAKGDIWQLVNISSTLRVRSGPGTNYKQVDSLRVGDKIEEIDRAAASNGVIWIKFSKGWCCSSSGNTQYFTLVKAASSTVTVVDKNPEPDTSTSNSSSGTVTNTDTASGYQPNINDILSYTNHNISDSEFTKIKNISGVFGLPYQFLPNTDIRLTGNDRSEEI